MTVLINIYARLYAGCFLKAVRAIRDNAWTLLLPMGVILALVLLTSLISGLRLGMAGGFALALGRAAVFSAYLYFVGEMVGHSRVSISEFRTSIGAYFWSVVSLFFVLFIAQFLLSMVLRGSPQGPTILLVVNLLLLVLLSAAPEVIYRKRTHGGIATIQASVKFLQENWLEWIIPNLPLFAAGYLLLYLSGRLGGLVVQLVVLAVTGALLHLAFVFRGFVFVELDGSSHRQRVFKYRNA